mmetsp:Transcript_57385/g.184383  ORF Transcript_57385/g.184383 Transcript_57385/m.184383 type:complete len:161 (+) Transcript_57385:3-485(+)
MTPAAWCNEQVVRSRAAAFKRGVTTSHWPHEFHAMDIDEMAPGFSLSKVQRELLSPQLEPGWKEEYLKGSPKPGRISLLPEAKYRVVREGGIGVYKSATTEWDNPLWTLRRDTEVKGYVIGSWLRLVSWPRSSQSPPPDGEEEMWSLLTDGDQANFVCLG